MPAIRLFHRRSILGGDDLQPAAFLSGSLHLLQITLLLGPIVAHIWRAAQAAAAAESSFWQYLLYDDSSTIEACRHAHYFSLLLVVYTAASFCVGLVSILLEWRISAWSSVGAPTQMEPRSSKVSYLLEIKLLPVCSILLFLVWICGICALSFGPQYYSCRASLDYMEKQQGNNNIDGEQAVVQDDQQQEIVATPWSMSSSMSKIRLWWVAIALLLLSQLSEVIVAWMYLLHLCRQPRDEDHGHAAARCEQEESVDMIASLATTLTAADRRHHTNHELVEEMWANRCAAACSCLGISSCFLFGGREILLLNSGVGDGGHNQAALHNNFGDVARALADYLETRGVLDVVPSDIAAGFLLLQHRQRQRMLQRSRQCLLSQNFDNNDRRTAASPSLEDEAVLMNSNSIQDDSGNGGRMTGAMVPPALTVSASYDNDNALETGCASNKQLRSGCVSRNRRRSGNELFIPLESSSSSSPERPAARNILRRSSPNDIALLEEGARYAKHALAIYTWVLYLYVHPLTGVFRLAAHGRCACCCNSRRRRARRRRHGEPVASSPRLSTSMLNDNSDGYDYDDEPIEGDNLCQTHKSALLMVAGLDDRADLVYAQLKSGFSQNPYCILLDHEWKTVVLSVRGTFSLEDCVTDVLIDPESLEALGDDFGFDATGQHCHGGVFACVKNVYRDLQRHGLLEQLLLGEHALYPDYNLKLVGHSLGAATCTILGFMLRPKFPNLRCINYCPVGCSLTWEMATQCQSWCTSFVLDCDLVPRLSLDAMETMRDEILELIGRIKVPKIEVARRLVQSSNSNPYYSRAALGDHLCFDPRPTSISSDDNAFPDVGDLLYSPEEVPDTEYGRQLARHKAIQEERRKTRVHRDIKLYPPGKLVHLVKTGERRACIHGIAKCLTCFSTNWGFQYTPIYIQNDDLDEIVVSPHMGTDHFPNRMASVLQDVARDYGVAGTR